MSKLHSDSQKKLRQLRTRNPELVRSRPALSRAKVLVGALFLLVVLAGMKSGNRKDEAGAVATPQLLVAAKVHSKISANATKPQGSLKASYAQALKINALARRSGLVQAGQNLQQTGKLAVTLRVSERCGSGDVEAIFTDFPPLKNQPASLILSVEPLEESSGHKTPVLVRDVSAAELEQGFSHEFAMQAPKGAAQFGIFLCSDVTNQRSCRGKSPRSADEIFAEVARNGSASPGRSDGIYAFNYLLIEPKTWSVLGGAKPERSTMSALTDYATAVGSSGNVRQQSDFAVNVSQKLATMPAEIGTKGVVMNLVKTSAACRLDQGSPVLARSVP